jgi:hypothetical protein
MAQVGKARTVNARTGDFLDGELVDEVLDAHVEEKASARRAAQLRNTRQQKAGNAAKPPPKVAEPAVVVPESWEDEVDSDTESEASSVREGVHHVRGKEYKPVAVVADLMKFVSTLPRTNTVLLIDVGATGRSYARLENCGRETHSMSPGVLRTDRPMQEEAGPRSTFCQHLLRECDCDHTKNHPSATTLVFLVNHVWYHLDEKDVDKFPVGSYVFVSGHDLRDGESSTTIADAKGKAKERTTLDGGLYRTQSHKSLAKFTHGEGPLVPDNFRLIARKASTGYHITKYLVLPKRGDVDPGLWRVILDWFINTVSSFIPTDSTETEKLSKDERRAEQLLANVVQATGKEDLQKSITRVVSTLSRESGSLTIAEAGSIVTKRHKAVLAVQDRMHNVANNVLDAHTYRGFTRVRGWGRVLAILVTLSVTYAAPTSDLGGLLIKTAASAASYALLLGAFRELRDRVLAWRRVNNA